MAITLFLQSTAVLTTCDRSKTVMSARRSASATIWPCEMTR